MRKLDKGRKEKERKKRGRGSSQELWSGLSDSPSSRTNSSHANGKQLGYRNASKQTHRHHPPPFFNAMILTIIARRAMKHFFLTIYFYAPSYPPFDFFLFLFLFNAKRHSKAKNFKSLRNPPFFTRALVAAVLFGLPSIHFNIRRAESRKKTNREKLVKKKERKKNLTGVLQYRCVFFLKIFIHILE